MPSHLADLKAMFLKAGTDLSVELKHQQGLGCRV
jgi:hypothetical protein